MNKDGVMIYQVALGAAVALAHSGLQAQTWQTVDDYAPGSQPMAAAVDSLGGIYVSGAGSGAGLLRYSANLGNSWVTLDSFGAQLRGIVVDQKLDRVTVAFGGPDPWMIRRCADDGGCWAVTDDLPSASISSIAMDSEERLYATGSTGTNGGWLVRTSADAGATWQATGTPSAPLRNPSLPVCVGTDLYVVATDTNAAQSVLKSVDGGLNWTNLWDAAEAHFEATTADKQGAVYLAGSFTPRGGNPRWVVFQSNAQPPAPLSAVDKAVPRRRPDRGWPIIDDYSPAGFPSAIATAAATDGAGNVYVAGVVWNPAVVSPVRVWQVRRREADSGGWTTIDEFSAPSGLSAIPHCIVCGPSGSVFCAGTEQTGDPNGPAHWIVRRYATQSATSSPRVRPGSARATLRVSWPWPSSGLVLESSPSFTSPSWSAVPEIPATTNGEWFVEVPTSETARYFRLRAPMATP